MKLPSAPVMAALEKYRLDPFADQPYTLNQNNQERKPWRKVALAVGLLTLGCVLLFTGVGIYVSGNDGGASVQQYASA